MLIKDKDGNVIIENKEVQNALIEAIVKNAMIDKENYKMFGEIKVTVNNRVILVQEEDLKEYFLRQV
ncbi:hypothetical protein [Brachyspira sp.]|uniref:hypothetical protein n=1 Tax=Brachyspira sp. TaxID=1977261 RepID=UPI003D7D4FFB